MSLNYSCNDGSVLSRFQVRFVESEFKALRAFVSDLALLLQFLREEAAPTSAVDGTLKSQISGWLRSITGLRFISTMLTQLDIDDALKEFSKKAQSDKSIIIFYPEIRDNLRARLEVLQKQLGPNAEARLPELRRSKFKYEKATRARHSGESSSDDDGDDIIDSAVARSQEVQINLQGCQPGHVKARMLQYQKDDVDVLIAEFDKRLPQHDAINHLARVFRFDLCPFKQGLIFKPVWAEKLREVYESITWLCENRYLSLSAHFATVEWGKLARFLQDNWRRFWDKDEVPAGAHAVTRAAHKPKEHLRLVGDDSLFEAVWDGDVHDIPQLAYMIDDMISLRLCQSDTERAGSFLNAVKHKGRTSLSFDMLSSLVSLAFNLPFLGEFDVDSLVRAWKAARHLLPVAKSGIGKSSVISRMRARKSDTFLFKKDTPFALTDFSIFAPKEKTPPKTGGSAVATAASGSTAGTPETGGSAAPTAASGSTAATASRDTGAKPAARAQSNLMGMWKSRAEAGGPPSGESAVCDCGPGGGPKAASASHTQYCAAVSPPPGQPPPPADQADSPEAQPPPPGSPGSPGVSVPPDSPSPGVHVDVVSGTSRGTVRARPPPRGSWV